MLLTVEAPHTAGPKALKHATNGRWNAEASGPLACQKSFLERPGDVEVLGDIALEALGGPGKCTYQPDIRKDNAI